MILAENEIRTVAQRWVSFLSFYEKKRKEEEEKGKGRGGDVCFFIIDISFVYLYMCLWHDPSYYLELLLFTNAVYPVFSFSFSFFFYFLLFMFVYELEFFFHYSRMTIWWRESKYSFNNNIHAQALMHLL